MVVIKLIRGLFNFANNFLLIYNGELFLISNGNYVNIVNFFY